MSLLSNMFFRRTAANPPPLAKPSPVVRAFQIVHNDITRAQRDPGFEALENADGERPDWYEYGPIRNYLRTMPLDESTLYGFMSPRFHEKTHLSAADVHGFIESSEETDVFTFSPYPCHGASFLNVFEQQDFFDPGFMHVAAEFFMRIDKTSNLRDLVNHSGNIVYCNFFFAKPKFWREWLRICEQLFDETSGGGLGESLNVQMQYFKDNGDSSVVQRKVFIMERVAPYLLASSNSYSVTNFPSHRLPVSQTHVNLRPQIHLLDELKRQYRETGRRELLAQYRLEQKRLMAVAWPGQELPEA